MWDVGCTSIVLVWKFFPACLHSFSPDTDLALAVDLIPLLSESMTGVALSMIIVCVSSAMDNCSQVSSEGVTG